jgi:hypothetical protein
MPANPGRVPGRRPRLGARAREHLRRSPLTTHTAPAAIALAVVLTTLTACAADAQPKEPEQPAAADAPIAGITAYEDLSRDHVGTSVTYDPVPPVGGAHSGGALQNCGFYSTPVQDEYAVHSLEHGAVWITYAADLPTQQVDTLRGLADSGTHVLVSPYEDIPSPVVASAWGLQLRLDSAEDPRLPDFVARFAEGPQSPEPGAPCSGSAGVPE